MIHFSIYLFIDIEDTAAIMVLPTLMTKGVTDLLKICSVSIHISFYTYIYIYIYINIQWPSDMQNCCMAVF